MNNKKLGTEFENELCKILKEQGFWVHFMSPDARGAQPFDIIAVKDNIPIAIDCKTCVANTFNISRLEDNQKFAFRRWLDCDNEHAVIAVKHDGKIYFIDYEFLIECNGKVRFEDCCRMGEWMRGI